jgi:hypothetical protein
MAEAWDQLLASEPELAGRLLSRVEEGARLLDRVDPGWHRRIAVDRLAMESCDRCVLGQLHGDFQEGFREIIATLPDWELYSAAEHGFTLLHREQDTDSEGEDRIIPRFAALSDLWRRQVLAREAK